MSYTGNFPKFNKVSADGKEVYFGDPNTDGSYRLVESAGSIHLEERVLGVWTDLGDIVGGGGGGGAVYNVIADDNVDFDATVNYIEISADKTLGSKNVADGKTTMLVVKNTDSSDHSLNFDSTVGTSATDDATAVKANSQNSVYILQGVNGGAVSGLLNNDIGNTFPTGVDGDLTITSGNTVQLNAGDVKDYNNIDIQAGGTLEILDPLNTGALTEIYAGGTFNIDGEIVARDVNANGYSQSGLTTIGGSYSYSSTQVLGGSGGAGGYPTGTTVPLGGAGTNGYGGGGGGGSALQNEFATPIPLIYTQTGGAGGANNGNGAVGSTGSWDGDTSNPIGASGSGGNGGSGNSTGGTGANGSIGTFVSAPDNYKGGNGGNGGGSGAGGGGSAIKYITILGTVYDGILGGGGGGGGQRGLHGGSIYLYCGGNITGSGTINLSGRDGFDGGNGANGVNRNNSGAVVSNPSTLGASGGGGGGGGAGGSGGHLIYTAASLAPTVDVSGGSGGAGGSQGAGNTATPPSAAAVVGSSGTNGNTGTQTTI